MGKWKTNWKTNWKSLITDWGLFTNDINTPQEEKKEKIVSWDTTSIGEIKEENPIKEENNISNIENSAQEPDDSEATYYIILGKKVIYSLLRKWYISSWVESPDNNLIKEEKFINNWCLRLFKKDNLPELQNEIIIKIELKFDNKYIIKNEKWEIFWMVWFLPLTTITWIIFKDNKKKEDFENPVPNMNDNFIIPKELCYVNEEIYKKCTNQFSNVNVESDNINEIVDSINHYSKLLWWLFFANYNAYLNNNPDNYWDQYIKFLQDIYNEIDEDLKNPQSSSYNIILNLAYTWKLSQIENIEDLCNILLNEHVINISDYLYIKKSYKSTIWGLSNFEEFFEYKNNNIDNTTWQIISFLINFCNNKSLEERSINLSNSLSWRGKIINPRVTFILWICCMFNNIVCEFSWDNSTKRKMKDVFSPIRKKILDDIYDFIVNNKPLNKWPDPEIWQNTSDTNSEWLTIKREYALVWENYSITKKLSFKEAYLMKIKQVYWKDFEWIKWTYLMALLLKHNIKDIPETDIENLLMSYLEKISNKNEELEQILELDQKYN